MTKIKENKNQEKSLNFTSTPGDTVEKLKTEKNLVNYFQKLLIYLMALNKKERAFYIRKVKEEAEKLELKSKYLGQILALEKNKKFYQEVKKNFQEGILETSEGKKALKKLKKAYDKHVKSQPEKTEKDYLPAFLKRDDTPEQWQIIGLTCFEKKLSKGKLTQSKTFNFANFYLKLEKHFKEEK